MSTRDEGSDALLRFFDTFERSGPARRGSRQDQTDGRSPSLDSEIHPAMSANASHPSRLPAAPVPALPLALLHASKTHPHAALFLFGASAGLAAAAGLGLGAALGRRLVRRLVRAAPRTTQLDVRLVDVRLERIESALALRHGEREGRLEWSGEVRALTTRLEQAVARLDELGAGATAAQQAGEAMSMSHIHDAVRAVQARAAGCGAAGARSDGAATMPAADELNGDTALDATQGAFGARRGDDNVAPSRLSSSGCSSNGFAHEAYSAAAGCMGRAALDAEVPLPAGAREQTSVEPAPIGLAGAPSIAETDVMQADQAEPSQLPGITATPPEPSEPASTSDDSAHEAAAPSAFAGAAKGSTGRKPSALKTVAAPPSEPAPPSDDFAHEAAVPHAVPGAAESTTAGKIDEVPTKRKKSKAKDKAEPVSLKAASGPEMLPPSSSSSRPPSPSPSSHEFPPLPHLGIEPGQHWSVSLARPASELALGPDAPGTFIVPLRVEGRYADAHVYETARGRVAARRYGSTARHVNTLVCWSGSRDGIQMLWADGAWWVCTQGEAYEDLWPTRSWVISHRAGEQPPAGLA
ncbi:hypothetical protein Q5752_006052 [Cryptotrichosporon argae]